MAGQPSICAGVGAAKLFENHDRTAGWNAARGPGAIMHEYIPKPRVTASRPSTERWTADGARTTVRPSDSDTPEEASRMNEQRTGVTAPKGQRPAMLGLCVSLLVAGVVVAVFALAGGTAVSALTASEGRRPLSN